jgi:hypothetical protein
MLARVATEKTTLLNSMINNGPWKKQKSLTLPATLKE